MVGYYKEFIEDMLYRNVVGLVGFDQFLVKMGIIINFGYFYMWAMKFSVSLEVKVVMEVMNLDNLFKLLEVLKLLVKLDFMVQCIIKELGSIFSQGLVIIFVDLFEGFGRGLCLYLGNLIQLFYIVRLLCFVCLNVIISIIGYI